MTYRLFSMSALLLGTALFSSACSIAPAMNAQETQIKTDLATDHFLPATRKMRDAIETQELFAQAAFWSNEYNLNPADLESAIKLASAVRKLGNPARAVEITQTTRALYPRDPYLLAEFAAALIASERSIDAISILDEGLATTPAYARLWSLKGAALDQQERYAEARQHYQRALRITPTDPNVMANVGLSYALSGDAVTAEQWLRRAMTMRGASASVRQNLVLVLQLQGKAEEAQRLSGMSQNSSNLTKSQPSFNQAPTVALPQAQRGPQARIHTGSENGKAFTSASEAARAMAARRSATGGNTQNSAAIGQPTQGMIYKSENQGQYKQNQTTAPAQQQTYNNNYPQQQPTMAGAAPVYTDQTDPQRRDPNRRRR